MDRIFMLACMLPAVQASCTPSETTFCMMLDVFTGETGYYKFAGYDGVSPDITVKIGETYVFDQSDASNWYHAVGFAYYPDGAHGATWGGDERDEVEGAGELLYKIDGAATTCPEAGDTGLDCYEPEFFYPRADWMAKKYTAELTITQEMADKSHGGVIYYFCHIHSKMSGKIIIKNADGSAFTPSANPTELELYSPSTSTGADITCGTYSVSQYAGGGDTCCDERFLCGALDTNFEKCLQAIDCKMNVEMMDGTTADSTDKIEVFAQQMIPHHLNAVYMARAVLKQVDATTINDVDDLTDILWEIVNAQNYQIHQFRNYLGSLDTTTTTTLDQSSSDTTTTTITTTTTTLEDSYASNAQLIGLGAMFIIFAAVVHT